MVLLSSLAKLPSLAEAVIVTLHGKSLSPAKLPFVVKWNCHSKNTFLGKVTLCGKVSLLGKVALLGKLALLDDVAILREDAPPW